MFKKLLCSFLPWFVLATASACRDREPGDPVGLGSVAVSWDIVSPERALPCDRVGATTVVLQLAPRGLRPATTAVFSCSDSVGATMPIAAGAYEAVVSLRGPAGEQIATSPSPIVVTVGANEETTIPLMHFTVQPSSEVSLSFEALTASSNCGEHQNGGAAITESSFTVENVLDGCVQQFWDRRRGPLPLEPYPSTCRAPTLRSCMERDEQLVSKLDPGVYIVRAVGMRNGVQCWQGTDVFVLPAGKPLLTKRVQLTTFFNPNC